MQLDEARQIAAEYNLEEGDKFDWYRMDGDKPVGRVTIDEIHRTGGGIRKVSYTIKANNGNVKECKESVKQAAGSIKNDWWVPVESEEEQ